MAISYSAVNISQLRKVIQQWEVYTSFHDSHKKTQAKSRLCRPFSPAVFPLQNNIMLGLIPALSKKSGHCESLCYIAGLKEFWEKKFLEVILQVHGPT